MRRLVLHTTSKKNSFPFHFGRGQRVGQLRETEMRHEARKFIWSGPAANYTALVRHKPTQLPVNA